MILNVQLKKSFLSMNYKNYQIIGLCFSFFFPFFFLMIKSVRKDDIVFCVVFSPFICLAFSPQKYTKTRALCFPIVRRESENTTISNRYKVKNITQKLQKKKIILRGPCSYCTSSNSIPAYVRSNLIGCANCINNDKYTCI